jgi:hypothetical protein
VSNAVLPGLARNSLCTKETHEGWPAGHATSGAKLSLLDGRNDARQVQPRHVGLRNEAAIAVEDTLRRAAASVVLNTDRLSNAPTEGAEHQQPNTNQG